MRTLKIVFLLFFILISCNNRKIKYSGLEDLFVGAHQILLYDNNEFRLELGAGSNEGKYEIRNDTIFLKYYENGENWPSRVVMTPYYFFTIDDSGSNFPIKIKRNK